MTLVRSLYSIFIVFLVLKFLNFFHRGWSLKGMQLLTGAEHFGNVIFRYSELPSQYHIDASIDVNRPRQNSDITCVLCSRYRTSGQGSFPTAESRRRKQKKINWGLKCNVHCMYFGMYISDFQKCYLMFQHIPNSAWLALPSPLPLYDKIIHSSETFPRLYGARTTTASLAAATCNDATVYHLSEELSTAM